MTEQLRRSTDQGERTILRPYVPGCPCDDCAESLRRMSPDVDQQQSAVNAEPGWEAYAGLSPQARYADGDR